MNTIMNDDAFAKKGFSISTDKSLIDFEMVYNYLSNDSYWAKNIPADRLKKAIENSICFGIYHQNKQIRPLLRIFVMFLYWLITGVWVFQNGSYKQ